MIITVKKNAEKIKVSHLIDDLNKQGLSVNLIQGDNYNVYGLVGDTAKVDENKILAYKCVESVKRIAAPYKLTNRLFHPQDTVVQVKQYEISQHSPIVIIGGPCSVEGYEMMEDIALKVKGAQGNMLRGGAYKPRTSPYAFQGMEEEGIKALVNASKKSGLPIVSELMSCDKLDEFVDNVDIIQIGARNMQNFALLKAVGKTKKPILLKRGLANTIEEWIMSAEYILSEGNPNVILCERGIRTFEKYTRNTLDLSVIPIIKAKTHLPIIIDPSHATGDYRLIESMSLAAIAAGADGLIIEVHDNPEQALSDGQQSLKPKKFQEVVEKCKKIAAAIDREIYEN